MQEHKNRQPFTFTVEECMLMLVHLSGLSLLALGDDGGGNVVQLQDGLMQRLKLLKSKQTVVDGGEEAHQGRQPLLSPIGYPN